MAPAFLRAALVLIAITAVACLSKNKMNSAQQVLDTYEKAMQHTECWTAIAAPVKKAMQHQSSGVTPANESKASAWCAIPRSLSAEWTLCKGPFDDLNKDNVVAYLKSMLCLAHSSSRH